MTKVYKNVKEYFKKTLAYSNVRFIFELTFVSLLGSILVVIMIIPLFILLAPTDPSSLLTPYIENNNPTIVTRFFIGTSIYAVLIAPWLETIFGQVIPFRIISFFSKNLSVKIALLAILFAILHINPIHVFTGFVLAWSYAMKSKSSRWQGFWITTTIHFLHNAVLTAFEILLLFLYFLSA